MQSSLSCKKSNLFTPFALILSLIALMSVQGCSKKPVAQDPAFAKYVESYTAGTISKGETIRIQLTGAVSSVHAINEPVQKELFDFSPQIKGKAYWTGARTIEFRPEEKLKPGQLYTANFYLGKLSQVPENLENFEFQFQVIKPSFKVELNGLKALNSSALDLMKLSGTIYFADEEAPSKIEKLFTADSEGKPISLKWSHSANSSTFLIDSISRGNQERRLNLEWTGRPIGAQIEGKQQLNVPKIGDFKVLDIKGISEPEQYVLVQFSDPILVAQDLNGLLTIGGVSDLQYTIDGSEVKIYSANRLEGNYQITVNQGIENISSKKITSTIAANVNFEDRRPSVTIPGKGTILPSSGKLTFPFEAVNLSAVDVTIIKIHENNIPQYLQINDFNGGNELRRVAKPVVRKTIKLDDKGLDLRKKTRFSLDIDKLLKTEPGAIYRITIGFRKSYSIYKCDVSTIAQNPSSEETREFYGERIDEDDEFWSRYDYYYPEDYDWEEKDDPCSNSYYTTERWASRNVIASNIGLIAKRGNDNNMLIAATDILTTDPLSYVQIKLLDYQQQVLETVTTDESGLATVELKRKPYMLIAVKGEQKGYLKLDDGSSLPLSRFNVGGDVVQRGIKGFIYGERGVWRPGDSIFTGFILEDKDKKLPQGHPVTFELFNPQNNLYKRIVQTKSLNGFYTFKTATDASAPTGNWIAKVKVGGATFQKTLKIETVVPNRLKINIDFDGRKELIKGIASKGTLSVKWLFGAPAQNLKAKIDATLTAGNTRFTGFPGFVFDDPTSTFETENKTIFEGNLNDNGFSAFSADIGTASNAPGILRANFSTKVFEPGGGFSIDNFSIPYHVFNAYAGIKAPEGDRVSGMLLTDQNHPIQIVNVNTYGVLIGGQRDVQVEVYKIQWRWWWDREDEDLSNFTQDRYNQLLKREIVTLSNGKGTYNFRINYPDWGRYLIRVKDLKSGHTTGQTLYVDWPGWAQREQQNNPTEASMLSFTANKEKFSVGEEITLTIPSSRGGRGLVSIENGSKVLKTWWIETSQGQTKFTFKAEKDMAPNVFVNVTLLQPHPQTINDLPIRMYGVIPILIEDRQTVLKPVISMADVLKPETQSSITISEASGKSMTYTIAIVDEGLLDLTRFKTPDPHSTFYAREALGVKTWDLFDNVIGAWGGDLERILSIGGDGDLNRNINPAKSNRFKPVVKFMGPFRLEKGQRQTHNFKLPQYIGSVRTMVIAGESGAYGFAEKAVEVKKPLMLLAALPRVIGPGESFKLPLTVFALDNKIKNVSLQIQSNNLIDVLNNKQSISFNKIGEKTAYAEVRVKNTVGLAKIKVLARSGNEQTEYNVELDIRNPNPYITSVKGVELAAGQSNTTIVAPIGTAGTNTGVLEVSSIPPINLSKRLNYLIQYPHGCVEQITSGLFPQLVLGRLIDLSDRQKASVERNIKAGIFRIRGFQLANGGLGYWPGSIEADEWGTNYGGHFLLEAQNGGYALPPGLLDRWKQFQRAKAVNWSPNSTNFYGGDLLQAYRLYLLATAKSPEIGAMNRLREFKYLAPQAKWRLAAAYNLIGRREIAEELIKGLPLQVKPYRQLGETFGSDLRDEAMILETLIEMGDKARASKLLYSVAAKLSTNQWYSTQTTGYALIAVAKYGGLSHAGTKLDFTYNTDGVKNKVTSSSYLFQLPLNFKGGKVSSTITNQGKNNLFVRYILQGQAPAGQNSQPVNNPEILEMRVTYKNRAGAEIDPDKLVQGTDLIAEVTLKNPGGRGKYEQMALTQIFPSGWEIINTRLADNEAAASSSPYTYRDIRDDRVLTYFNLGEGQSVTYRVLLNASYTGRYFLPATNCEAMYDNSIQALIAGKWVEVSERKVQE